MILDIRKIKNLLIEQAYRSAMRDLSKFYGINWIHSTPNIMIVHDRKTIDALNKKNTEPWLVGWTDKYRNLFVLDFKKFGKESSHKYSKEQYKALIKHELSHLFVDILARSKNSFRPTWLNEGLALYTAGQNRFGRKPNGFHEFLAFYDRGGAGVYSESGFFVEFLVKKFGKKRLLRLIKSTKNITSKKQFNSIFEKLYGFTLSYVIINNLYQNKNRLSKN